MEIEKLALYAGGTGVVTLDDVEAVVSDVAASVLNTLIDAAFDGRREAVERDARRFRHEGLDPGQVLGSALRHALTLLATRLDNPDKSPSLMAASWRGLHFKRKASIEGQLATWGGGDPAPSDPIASGGPSSPAAGPSRTSRMRWPPPPCCAWQRPGRGGGVDRLRSLLIRLPGDRIGRSGASPPPYGEGSGVGVVQDRAVRCLLHHPHIRLLPAQVGLARSGRGEADLGQARGLWGRRAPAPIEVLDRNPYDTRSG